MSEIKNSISGVNLDTATNGLKEHHILLVEDDLVNQRYVEAILVSMGLTCTLCSNGKEAIDLIEQQSFDLILMDIEMPVMNGIEATKYIRDELHLWHIPVIALTASSMGRRPHVLIEIGMTDVVTKPFQVTHLKEVIGHNLNNRDEMSTFEKQIKNDLQLAWMTEQSGGDIAFSKQLLGVFLGQFPDEYQRLTNAWHKRDWQTVKFISHKLKSSLRLFGLEETAHKLDRIEQEILKKGFVDNEPNQWILLNSSLQSALDLVQKGHQSL
jgi:CheY-like chemotaxis protein